MEQKADYNAVACQDDRMRHSAPTLTDLTARPVPGQHLDNTRTKWIARDLLAAIAREAGRRGLDDVVDLAGRADEKVEQLLAGDQWSA